MSVLLSRARRAGTNVALRGGVAVVAGAVALTLAAPTASAAPKPQVDPAKLAKKVTTEGLMEHLRAFQAIADANGGTRASGTPGYDRSADYVARVARQAGLVVTRQTFTFPFFRELGPATLTRVDVEPDTTYPTSTLEYSGNGTVQAPVQPVDINLSGDRASTSGCEDSDFAGFTRGSIALVQRGTCTFEDKIQNAVEAGAVGVVVFNQGNTPARSGLLEGVTLGKPFGIPVVGASFATGQALAQPGAVVRIGTNTESRQATTENVIAETRRGNPNNVVVVGAHLDSVIEGPGINDNGTGSAAILEVATELAKATKNAGPVNKVRFIWFGAEESGLLGSEHYVDNLTKAQRDAIALYLNFDMVGSPNFARFVYDGDNSLKTPGATIPAGSAQIEQAFTRYFNANGLASEPTEFSGRSDYGPFIAVGIPAGGLFTGAEGVKTAEQATRYGGTAGIAYDPCYHEACDTIQNVNTTVFTQNAKAIAYVVAYYANDTFSVNGVRPSTSGKAKPRADKGKGKGHGAGDASHDGKHMKWAA